MNGISRDTFKDMPPTDQMMVVFDYLKSINGKVESNSNQCKEHCIEQEKECDARFKPLEANRSTDAKRVTIGAAGGGFMAFMVQWLWQWWGK